MSLQLIIVIVAIIMSVAYIIYRAWKAFREAAGPYPGCSGCPLKDKCKPTGHDMSCEKNRTKETKLSSKEKK